MHGLLEGLGKDSVLEYEYRQSYTVSHNLQPNGKWALRLGGGRKNEVCTCVEEVKVKLPAEARLMDEGDGVWDLALDSLPSKGECDELSLDMEIVFRPPYGVPPKHLNYVIRPNDATTSHFLFSCHVHYPSPGHKEQ
jgi:hypothetical protein